MKSPIQTIKLLLLFLCITQTVIGQNPTLHQAVNAENAQEVEKIVKNPKTNLWLRDENGRTALDLAQNNIKIYKNFLSINDDELKNLQALKETLKNFNGAKTAKIDTDDNSLIVAAVLNDTERVKELIDQGKNPNQIDPELGTPLINAAKNGNKEIALLLLNAGADQNYRDKDTNNAFDWVVEKIKRTQNARATLNQNLETNEKIARIIKKAMEQKIKPSTAPVQRSQSI